MRNHPQPGKVVANTQDAPSSWVQWATLRPTQGAVGYVQVEAKKSSYRELDPEKRRSFAEEQAITVVLGPSAVLHVIDHHHWGARLV
jgi:hypothetical protein